MYKYIYLGEIKFKLMTMKDLEEHPSRILIPKRSRFCYLNVYNQFIHWVNEHKIQEINEEVLIVYFDELNQSGFKPSTLYKISSAIKSILNALLRMNIDEYSLLKKWLFNNSTNYHPHQAPIFTKEEIHQFLEIQDPKLLKFQVATALMWFGGLRRAEGASLEHQNVTMLKSESMCFYFYFNACLHIKQHKHKQLMYMNVVMMQSEIITVRNNEQLAPRPIDCVICCYAYNLL